MIGSARIRLSISQTYQIRKIFLLSEGSYLWNQFLTNLEFCQRFQIKPIDVHYLACTLIRFHIHKNFVVGRGIRTHATSAKPKEDSRSVSTAIGAGAIKSASVISFVQTYIIAEFWGRFGVCADNFMALPTPNVP